MTRYRLFVRQVRYEDYYVEADSPEEARAAWEAAEDAYATDAEQDRIERGFYEEVTESELEEVTEQ